MARLGGLMAMMDVHAVSASVGVDGDDADPEFMTPERVGE